MQENFVDCHASLVRNIFAHSFRGKSSVLFMSYFWKKEKDALFREFASNIYPHHLVVACGRVSPSLRNCENLSAYPVPEEVFGEKNGEYDALESKLSNEHFCFDEFHRSCSVARLEEIEKGDNGDGRVEQRLLLNYAYVTMLVKLFRPKLMLIWNAYHPLMRGALAVARQNGVQTMFVEYGLLPGTINFDISGQMGASAVATQAEDFRKLPVNCEDIQNAELALRLLRKSGANRKAQPNSEDLKNRVNHLSGGRPIIFYAGHNEYSSGTTFASEREFLDHSPIFLSSFDCAEFLLKLSKKNNWFLLYKPHPSCKNDGILFNNEYMLRIDDGNINDCIDVADVTTTILSQVSYVSLIRGKPTVMFGHHQLRDKGAIYEVNDLQNLEKTIFDALNFGITKNQSNESVRHIAQILRYYLYRFDDALPSSIRCQSISDAAAKIREMINLDVFSDMGGEQSLIRSISKMDDAREKKVEDKGV